METSFTYWLLFLNNYRMLSYLLFYCDKHTYLINKLGGQRNTNTAPIQVINPLLYYQNTTWCVVTVGVFMSFHKNFRSIKQYVLWHSVISTNSLLSKVSVNCKRQKEKDLFWEWKGFCILLLISFYCFTFYCFK